MTETTAYLQALLAEFDQNVAALRGLIQKAYVAGASTAFDRVISGLGVPPNQVQPASISPSHAIASQIKPTRAPARSVYNLVLAALHTKRGSLSTADFLHMHPDVNRSSVTRALQRLAERGSVRETGPGTGRYVLTTGLDAAPPGTFLPPPAEERSDVVFSQAPDSIAASRPGIWNGRDRGELDV